MSIDGKTITLLQGGGYALAMVEPGVHEIAFPEMLLPMLHRNGDPYNMPPARLTITAQPNEAIFLKFGFYKPYERGQTRDSEGMEHLPVVKLSTEATYVTVTSLSEEEAVTKFARNRGSPMPSAQRPIKNYP